MNAHIVLPARRSNVPGEWVRPCSNPDCFWAARGPDPADLAEPARAHHEDPDADRGAS